MNIEHNITVIVKQFIVLKKFKTMIDNETFRLRIGLFSGKKGINSKTKLNTNHYRCNTSSAFIDNITSSHNPYYKYIHFLMFIYFIVMIYFWSVLLSMCMSFNISLGLEAKSEMLFHHGFSRFLIPTMACSHIKIFSCILTFFVCRRFFSPHKSLKHRFSNRLKRMMFNLTLWLYSINSILIIIVNPSILNPGPQGLSALYQNVQGFIPVSQLSSLHPSLDLNKIAEFQAYVNSSKPDIIALNETWLKKSISDNEILPNYQYEVFRNDRTRKTHPPDPENPNKFRENGGGVLLAVRSDLDLSTKRLPVRIGMEMLAVQITLPNNESFVVCTCYRVGTLGQHNHDIIVEYIRSIVSKRKPPKIYIIGDFNLPNADWPRASSRIPIEQQFIDSFNGLALSQLITSPTHKGGNTLDILLTNFESTVDQLKVHDQNSFCKSDHFPVSFSPKIKFSRKKSPKRKVFNFKKANWDMLNHDLCSINWNFLNSTDPDTGWKTVKECIFSLAEKHIPKVTVKSEFQPPWFDCEVYSACRSKDRLRAKWKETGSLPDELRWTVSRKDFKNLSAQKLRDNLFNSDDPALITKKFWSHVKYSSNSCRIPNSVNYSSKVRFKPKDQAELFNSFFMINFLNLHTMALTYHMKTIQFLILTSVIRMFIDSSLI